MAAPGQFVWFEVMTRKLDQAKTFYGAVAGWHFHDWEVSNGAPYVMCSPTSDPKGSVGGMMEMQEPEFPAQIPSHIMGYISVDNADDIVQQAVDLGAQVVHGPADIPKVGRFAILSDPQGGMFSILESLNNTWEKERPTPGHVSWCELLTTDIDAAYAFYAALFGWTIKSDMDMGGGEVYRMVSCPNSPSESDYGFGGIFKMPSQGSHAAWNFYVAVADLDASLAAVAANGGKILNGPMDVPGGDRVAQCVDAEGTHFALTTIQG